MGLQMSCTFTDSFFFFFKGNLSWLTLFPNKSIYLTRKAYISDSVRHLFSRYSAFTLKCLEVWLLTTGKLVMLSLECCLSLHMYIKACGRLFVQANWTNYWVTIGIMAHSIIQSRTFLSGSEGMQSVFQGNVKCIFSSCKKKKNDVQVSPSFSEPKSALLEFLPLAHTLRWTKKSAIHKSWSYITICTKMTLFQVISVNLRFFGSPGHLVPHACGVQMPWCVRLLWGKDLLEIHATLPQGGKRHQREVWWRHWGGAA